ncbi:MAG: FAD-dependent oxidoreductase, partial [Rhodospirillales bacterium]|nr:FAD-dependent oxidoreductase [Rhodospirillales bacterium]
MSIQTFRIAEGGRIDRSKPLRFTFNGKQYTGHQGDTLASALLANGVHLVGRSFKYHRPRGIMSAGAEETSAMVNMREGNRSEPNIRATQVELYDGLVANSQNCWPSVGFDINGVNKHLARFIPAGFYYKTFKWPGFLWMTYEKVIRHAAGMGTSPVERDPDRYEHMHAYCDVLIAGAGPAGLMAAKSAAASGARVMLVDEQDEFGGQLKGRNEQIDGKPAMQWVEETYAELAAMEEVTLLPKTVVASYYDHNMLVLNQRTGENLPSADGYTPRQVMWKVWAKQVVLATGSIERPLVFGNNDLPGVMMTGAVQTYVNQYGVLPGKNAVIMTNNDSAYQAVSEMHDAGMRISAVVDIRKTESKASEDVRSRGIPVFHDHVVFEAVGGKRVKSVKIMALNEAGNHLAGSIIKIDCDLLCMSGGWTPSVHLFSQARGKLRWDDALTTFVPDVSFQQERSAGANKATWGTSDCLKEGSQAGADAAKAAGFDGAKSIAAPKAGNDGIGELRAMWRVPLPPHTHIKRFVDIQDDVSTDDVELSVREGYKSVEHLKRYTALGMGTDQGKTSNINGLAILSEELGKPIPEVGHTTFRPPYTGQTMGAIAGTEKGHHFSPHRRTALQSWHEDATSNFNSAGMWSRPAYYQKESEGMWDAIYRETKHVRSDVGMFEVSPLGKIDVQGKDAAEFLNRCYINGFGKLPVGKCRYGVMLREDGMVFDDGVTSRISENHFMMTTTTAK